MKLIRNDMTYISDYQLMGHYPKVGCEHAHNGLWASLFLSNCHILYVYRTLMCDV